jgi:catechol 2,3-dioxygenase-like lactoylglutathione lyase family enzyme
MEKEKRMPKPDLMGMVVRDMASTLRFYRRLGMEIPASADQEGHVEVVLPGGFRIAWDTLEVIHSFNPEYRLPDTPQPALAFLCDSPAEVNKLYAELLAEGYHGHQEPWDAFWGQRYAMVLDPDNRLVDLFAPL